MRIALFAILALWLSGCAQQPAKPLPALSTVWTMEAKIAFSSQQESGSAYARFDASPGLFSGELQGTFGIGKTRIDCNLSYCNVSNQKGNQRLWLTEGKLSLQPNLVLPVHQLPDWLVGKNLDSGVESGWTIEIQAWQEQNGLRLPQKLRLTHADGNNLKIFVTRWTPGQ